jgi:beta-galactosidase
MTDETTANLPLHIGAAYYPEHWPEERWAEDVRLMQEAGFTVARLGEFAWSTFEPASGKFNFEWMDRAITLLAVNGIKTVLGTPTAVPPAWLVAESPELLAIDESGRRVQFGNRCHYCVNSPDMHTATRRIVAAMTEHFGPNPNVIGWQIDNEYNRVCYCEHCRAAFQQFLKAKYQSLDELNQRWSTAYWSQTYSAWEQIPTPIGPHNPSLMLEWKRFITHSYRNFQKIQIDLLRPHLAPEVWITHNFMGWFDGFDHYELSADLDMASWDWYVGTGHNDPYFSNSTHDLTRGFKRKNFWVMETQPGTVNWSRVNNSLYKGEARTMAWQAVAHGAAGFLYWQWRSALGGQEQYHGTLVDQSGQPRPFYAEAKQIAEEFKKVLPLFADTSYPARTAILNDYESRWSIQWQKHHKDFDYLAHLQHYYRPLAQANIPVDIISPDQSLKDYRLVIAPSMIIMDQERFEHIKEFVARGGYLILTPRTAMKNRDNALLPERQPGPLREMAGVEVQEFFALNEEVPVKGNWFNGVSRTWAETLNIIDSNITIVVAKYGDGNGWLDNQIAISVKGVKSGMIYYVGTYLDEAAQSSFINHVAQVAGINKILETPVGVTAARRLRPFNQEVIIVINHTRKEQVVNLANNTYDDNLTGARYAGQMKMAPLGVAILTKAI